MTSSAPTVVSDESPHYEQAIAALEHALGKLARCSDVEKRKLQGELRQLRDMHHKLLKGQVEIIVFGEISTGKSALINALVGNVVSSVDVQGGWTREVWQYGWQTVGYRVPGLESSQVVLVDTPGLNEVGGQERGEMAREAARRADLILFLTDSDLNETEYSALVMLASVNKPIIVVDEGGYWAPFIAMVDHIVASGFAGERTRQLFQVVKSVEDVLPALAATPAPKLAPHPEKL